MSKPYKNILSRRVVSHNVNRPLNWSSIIFLLEKLKCNYSRTHALPQTTLTWNKTKTIINTTISLSLHNADITLDMVRWHNVNTQKKNTRCSLQTRNNHSDRWQCYAHTSTYLYTPQLLNLLCRLSRAYKVHGVHIQSICVHYEAVILGGYGCGRQEVCPPPPHSVFTDKNRFHQLMACIFSEITS
jgi:hypothetical protein